ncbi:MAG: phosphatase PAP2 family protein [Sphingobacteriaceae bacterium]
MSFFLLILCIPTHAQNWDIRLLDKLNSAPQAQDKTWQFISNNSSKIDMALPVGLFITGCLKHNESIKNKGAEMGISYLANTILTQTFKNTIRRARPFDAYPAIIFKKSDGGGYSMPSGHTSSAFSTATSLSLNFPKWYVVAPAYTYAAAVGYSRMYLGVHYPSDVLAGALLGSGTAYLTWKWNKKLQKRRK